MQSQEFSVDHKVDVTLTHDEAGKEPITLNFNLASADVRIDGQKLLDASDFIEEVRRAFLEQELPVTVPEGLLGEKNMVAEIKNESGKLTDYQKALNIIRSMLSVPILEAAPEPKEYTIPGSSDNPMQSATTEGAKDKKAKRPIVFPSVTDGGAEVIDDSAEVVAALKAQAASAHVNKTLTSWPLNEEGLSAQTFPMKDQDYAVILVTFGPAAAGHIHTVSHAVEEIKKRLGNKDFHMADSTSFVKYNKDEIPHAKPYHYTGVILVPTHGADHTQETLDSINEVLKDAQRDFGVLELKRGNTHRKIITLEERATPPQPDPVAIALRTSLEDAVNSGLIEVHCKTATLDHWINKTARNIRNGLNQGRDEEGLAAAVTGR